MQNAIIKILSGVALLALLQAPAASGTESVSGRTELTVTLPEILILYHYDLVNIQFDALTYDSGPDNDAYYEISDGGAVDETGPLAATFASTNLNVQTGIVSANAPLNKVAVTLKNSYAVRAISTDNVTAAISIANPTLTHINGGEIKVEEAALSQTDITPSWDNPVIGDITFDLNLSEAQYAGLYSHDGTAGDAASEVSDTFLITLTGN